jgi:hypothetical protein
LDDIQSISGNKLHNIESFPMLFFESGGSLLAFFFLTCHVITECKQGIEYYWGYEYEKTCSIAYAEDPGFWAGTHTAEFRGSFVSNFTGLHKFKLWSGVYGASELYTPSTKFIFDWEERGTGENDWYWSTSLMKDFRYQMRLTVTNYYYDIKISIAVSYTGRDMADLDGDLISTCEESGCRDTGLSQLPYNCQPSPSLSLSPSPSLSHSPSPTHSQTPSPTSPRSPVASASLTFHTFDGSHRQSLALTFWISFAFSASVFVKVNEDDAAGANQIGLIVGIVCSLLIGIVCLIIFLILKKIRKQSEKSVDILHHDIILDDYDYPSVVPVTTTCGLSDDTLPTKLMSVTHPSDCYDQSSLDGL